MEHPDLQNLKYGIIYVCGNPKQTHNLRWFATMIEPMIRPLTLQWVETWQFDHTLIVARRFNIGNMGKYATVQLHLNRYGHSDSYSLLAAVHAFSDCLEDVMDAGDGDVIINEEDYRDHTEMPQGRWGKTTSSVPMSDVLNDYLEMRQDNTRVAEPVQFDIPKTAQPREEECSKVSKFKRRLKKRFSKEDHNLKKSDKSIVDNECQKWILPEESFDVVLSDITHKGLVPGVDDDEATGSYEPELLELEAEEIQEFKRIETEYERDVRDLRARIVAFIAKYHQDPQQVMTTMLEGKVLIGNSTSRVLVNGDMKIVLPEYDEMEIKMPAMCRTLYILFMKHRKQGSDGIVLKDIDEYRQELLEIYGMVKPGASEERIRQTVDNLCAPFGDSLNQMISRANRCIRNVITDKQLASNYCITGERGQAYNISLDPQFLELPRAVTGT